MQLYAVILEMKRNEKGHNRGQTGGAEKTSQRICFALARNIRDCTNFLENK